MTNQIKALAKHLDISSNEAKELITSGDYEVLTDKEADTLARKKILESIWAFRADFLAGHLKAGIDSEVVELIQCNDKCEDNNAAILSLIEDVDHLIHDAILSDGRGHFMSSYDGQENEETINNKTYYIYRNN